MLKRVFILVFVVYMSFSIIGVKSASIENGFTPPLPPAQLILPDEKDLNAIILTGKTYEIPCKLIVNESIGKLSVNIIVSSETSSVAKEKIFYNKKYPITIQNKETNIGLTIPVMDNPGNYRIEFRITSTVNLQEFLIDRKIFFQQVESGQKRILTPNYMRQTQVKEKKNSFDKNLDKYPADPDLKLLFPPVIKIPTDFKISPNTTDDLLVRVTGPFEAMKPYIIDKSDESWSRQDPITVRGRVVFRDFAGTWRGLPNVAVDIYDSDFGFDEYLGSVATDWDGNWIFSVNNNDGFLQDGRDIYYKIRLENSRWSVGDAEGNVYAWISETYNDRSDGILDCGTVTASTDMESMQIFNIVNRGWNHIVTVGGQDPGYVEVRYPCSSTSFSPSEKIIRIEMEFNDGPDVVLHEYGHWAMNSAFGGIRISPGGPHSFSDGNQDEGLAYSEGWATAFALSVCPDGLFNWHEGNTESPGEWPGTVQRDWGWPIERASSTNRTGEKSELRIAAALNDFLDAPDDDNGRNLDRGRNDVADRNASCRIPLSVIYNECMYGYVYNNFLEFWSVLEGNIENDVSMWVTGRNIMHYNWMSQPGTMTCVASKIVTAKEPNRKLLLSGLRRFRDYGLKSTSLGRSYIQKYYSNSPELAIILIKNPQARQNALSIIKHFSDIGNILGNEAEFKEKLKSNPPFIPENVNKSILSVLDVLEKEASPELKKEIPEIRSFILTLQGLTYQEMMDLMEKPSKDGQERVINISPQRLSPESLRADWDLIRRELPKSE